MTDEMGDTSNAICINCDPAMWKTAADCPWNPSCLALEDA